MRILAYEHITGGGLRHPPPSLVREGDAMLRALLRDLGELPGIGALTLRDERLPPLGDLPVRVLPVRDADDAARRFAEALDQADAVWPVAPETGGVLESLSRRVLAHGRTLLGSRPDAVRLAASKRGTARHLAQAGIPVAEAYGAGEALPDGAWVVKPDDGAGCDDTWLCANHAEAAARLRTGGRIAQRFVPGDAASLSLLCLDGDARLLCVNRQRVTLQGGRFRYRGSAVNALPRDAVFTELAQRVAAAIPGLWGYAGIDLVLGETGSAVIEVNPRLTTSYAGLRAALGANPAALVLALADGRLPDRIPAEREVEVGLQGGVGDGD